MLRWIYLLSKLRKWALRNRIIHTSTIPYRVNEDCKVVKASGLCVFYCYWYSTPIFDFSHYFQPLTVFNL